ncbi:MAG: class I SAM-dependent methyltransferase, partial [Methanobacteriota archaeon]
MVYISTIKDTQRKIDERSLYERSYDKKLNKPLDFSPLTWIKGTEDRKLARCYDLLGICTDKRILDIGCGDGFRSLRYAMQGGVVIGFDISRSAIEIAKKRTAKYPNAIFLLADAEYMPFKSSCFDVVSCIALIEHIDNQEKMVSEINRLLRINGKVIIQTINKKNKYTVNGILKTFFPLYDKRMQDSAGHSYDRFLTVDELGELCLNRGLKIDYVAYTETFVDWIWIHIVLLKLTKFGS